MDTSVSSFCHSQAAQPRACRYLVRQVLSVLYRLHLSPAEITRKAALHARRGKPAPEKHGVLWTGVGLQREGQGGGGCRSCTVLSTWACKWFCFTAPASRSLCSGHCCCYTASTVYMGSEELCWRGTNRTERYPGSPGVLIVTISVRCRRTGRPLFRLQT